MRRIAIALCTWVISMMLLVGGISYAQDGLNLPSEMFVLFNDGRLDSYGIGAAGITTIMPGEEPFIIDFGVAPDGNWLAYRTQEGLFLHHMYRDDTILLDSQADVPPLRGQGETLAWTHNGDTLAYTTRVGLRVYFNEGSPNPVFVDVPTTPLLNLQWSPDGSHLAAEAEDNIWWIYRRDRSAVPPAMTLVSAIPASDGVAWVGSAQLVFTPPEGGLILMDMANANQQTVLLDDDTIYAKPYYRADENAILVFGRGRFDTELEEGAAILKRYDLSADEIIDVGVEPVALSHTRWAPRGELMIRFQGGALALVHPPSGQGFTLPISSAVAYSWGAIRPQPTLQFPLPRDLYLLAPDINGIKQVWRLSSNQAAFTVSPANEDIAAFDVSANGAIAYASEGQLWYHEPGEGNEPLSLDEVSPIYQISFSPNGQQIAYSTDEGIWLVGIDGEEAPTLLLENSTPVPRYSHPRFAPRLNALLVQIDTGEELTQHALDLNTGELLPGAAATDGFWLQDGRIGLYNQAAATQGITADITIVDVISQQRPPELALSLPYPLAYGDVREVNAGKLMIAVQREIPGAGIVSIVEAPIGGESQRIGVPGFMTQPTLSPDGAAIAGLTYTGGALLVYDLQNGVLYHLAQPLGILSVKWSP